MNFKEVERAIGYKFKNKELLKRALTLASADAECNNQTLEFFGDAILEFIVSEKIFGTLDSEGELTETRKLVVSDKALTPVSQKLGLDKFLIRSANDTANKKATPSAYEAVLAAIYLDGGMKAAKKFVLDTLNFTPVSPQINYKGKLQELLQSQGKPLPVYLKEDIGTPRKPLFRVRVEVFEETFEGVAETVKQAEKLAAKAALERVETL